MWTLALALNKTIFGNSRTCMHLPTTHACTHALHMHVHMPYTCAQCHTHYIIYSFIADVDEFGCSYDDSQSRQLYNEIKNTDFIGETVIKVTPYYSNCMHAMVTCKVM